MTAKRELHLRYVGWVIFFITCLSAWLILYKMVSTMNVDLIGLPSVSDMGMGAADGMMNMTRFVPLFIMWAIMMAAMMLPTFMPTVQIYGDLITAEIGSPSGLAGLAVGYSVVWVGFAAVIALAQMGLVELGLIGAMGQSLSPAFSAALLICVGLYQFSSVKDRCVAHCRSPMAYFLANWRPGLRGGLRLGMVNGAYCAGCCWGLMALGFAGGMMSLLWMGLATVLMTLEKMPDIGVWLTRPIGVCLIALGLYVGGLTLL